MFYCNPCARKRGWPETPMFKSRGACEVCNVRAICNDVPSKYLPAPALQRPVGYTVTDHPPTPVGTHSTMSIYTITDHPSDYPDNIVVRRWLIGSGVLTAQESTLVDSLDEARAFIADIAPDTVCIPHAPDDDPVIIETWV